MTYNEYMHQMFQLRDRINAYIQHFERIGGIDPRLFVEYRLTVQTYAASLNHLKVELKKQPVINLTMIKQVDNALIVLNKL